LAHLPYLAFGTIPRYGYTGMPFVCLFAVYFLSQVRVRENQRPRYLSAAFFLLVFLVILPADLQGVLISAGVLTGLAFLGAVLLKGTLSLVSALILLRTVRPESSQSVSIFSALSILMVFAILAAVEAGPSREVVVDIAPGQKLIRKVDLAGKTPDWALILLDSSRRKPGLGLYLNGHQVAQEPMPLYRFGQDGFLMSSYQVFSGLLGIDTDRLRQWRAVSVPVAWLSSDGSNTVCLKAEREKLTLFASVPGLEGEQEIPSLTEFNFTKLASDLHDLDARIPAEKIRTVEPAYLIDGENKSRINGLPRLLVACGYRTEPHAAAALAKPVTATMLVEKSIVQPGVPLVLSSREPLSITGRGSFKITLQGIISSDADAGKMTLDLVCRRFLKPDFSVSVFGKPKEVVFNQGGSKKFSYSEFVPLSAVDGSAFRLEAMFGTGRKPIVVESLTVLMEPFESPDFRECSVEVF
ncbi:MAG: hypothetical protein K8F91_26685, partial [Candidatus Obscuribacterales bacterium]|nr:hypothetical protein [Candidatus Obscuribacterales bacterium]